MYYLCKTDEFHLIFKGLEIWAGMGPKKKIGSREEWIGGGLEGWKWRGKFTVRCTHFDIILVLKLSGG